MVVARKAHIGSVSHVALRAKSSRIGTNAGMSYPAEAALNSVAAGSAKNKAYYRMRNIANKTTSSAPISSNDSSKPASNGSVPRNPNSNGRATGSGKEMGAKARSYMDHATVSMLAE